MLHPRKWLNEGWASKNSHLSPWLCKPILSYSNFFLLLMKMTISWLFFYEWENKRLSVVYALQCPTLITGRIETNLQQSHTSQNFSTDCKQRLLLGRHALLPRSSSLQGGWEDFFPTNHALTRGTEKEDLTLSLEMSC